MKVVSRRSYLSLSICVLVTGTLVLSGFATRSASACIAQTFRQQIIDRSHNDKMEDNNAIMQIVEFADIQPRFVAFSKDPNEITGFAEAHLALNSRKRIYRGDSEKTPFLSIAGEAAYFYKVSNFEGMSVNIFAGKIDGKLQKRYSGAIFNVEPTKSSTRCLSVIQMREMFRDRGWLLEPYGVVPFDQFKRVNLIRTINKKNLYTRVQIYYDIDGCVSSIDIHSEELGPKDGVN